METIAAIATAAGEAGIGVVRLSGPSAVEIADRIFQAKTGRRIAAQKSHTARYGRIAGADEALALFMRGPKSYTGEDVVELSVHGGPAVLNSVLRLVLGAGARLAEPGEFTKRAFLNGRMDLLQAEAVLDLIQAKTERVRSWAQAQLEGDLSRKMRRWKEELLHVQSQLEASVDFPDDLPETESAERIGARLQTLLEEARRLLRDSELTFVAKRGFRVVLCGRPNVGKSSLMNRLTRSDRVIVTPHPGTTRDVVEEEASLDGFAVRFFDTAGVRDTDHPIEKEGVERSKKAIAGADLALCVLDSSQPLTSEDEALLAALGDRPAVLVLNKSDLPRRLTARALEGSCVSALRVDASCVEERGTEALERAILSRLTQGHAEISQEPLLTSIRQKSLLENVSKDLERAVLACEEARSPELIASDTRQALNDLAEMVGEVYTDDILEVLFSQFCIGK